jgi:hypothetical protein
MLLINSNIFFLTREGKGLKKKEKGRKKKNNKEEKKWRELLLGRTYLFLPIPSICSFLARLGS